MKKTFAVLCAVFALVMTASFVGAQEPQAAPPEQATQPAPAAPTQTKDDDLVIDPTAHVDILLMNAQYASMATVYGGHATLVRYKSVYFSGIGAGWRDVDGRVVPILPIATGVFYNRKGPDLAFSLVYVLGKGHGFGFGLTGTF